MLLTREIINKNIKFKDYSRINDELVNTEYDYSALSSKIDCFKNYLQNNYTIVPGQSALIGVRHASLTQLAVVFAFLELGVSLAIVDYERDDDFIDHNYIDPKTKLLLPIDFHVVNNSGHNKFKIFQKICTNTIILDDIKNYDDTPNVTINCTKDSIALKCTSSGTTGTPKVIHHTHEFLYSLCRRNSGMFAGNAAFIFNLNHGSSPATYFFPILMSEKILECQNLSWMILKEVLNLNVTDHLLIPYSHQIDSLLTIDTFNNNLTIYTLSTIKRNWIPHIKSKKLKNIVSFFGSNETSGPVLINQLLNTPFLENKFTLIDNFYDIEINETGEILITLPIYNKQICTNDKFKKIKEHFLHLGRSDMLRINGLNVNVEKYEHITNNYVDGQIIYDTTFNTMYLAIWEDDPKLEQIHSLNYFLKSISNNAHFISKFQQLDYKKFCTGVKLDQELLRDYFRNYCNNLLQ